MMKRILGILPLAVLVACGPSSNYGDNVEELVAKRDSLQAVELETQKEINTLNAEIAKLDTTTTKDELKLIKKISMQKNKIIGMSKKLKTLENELASMHKEKTYVPVAVKDIKPEEFKNYIVVYGNVEADNYAVISPEMNGRIEKIYVREGQSVSSGQLLVSLNTDAIEKQIQGTKSALDLARTTFEKQDTLWKQGIGSEIQYLSSKNQVETLEAQLETLEAQVRMSQVRAPFSGIVDKIYPKEGEMAGPGFPVVEFVNLGKLTIRADISESYIGQVHEGNMVELSFSAIDGVINTPIRRTSKVINPNSRTFEVELNINNKGEKIKPNMVSTIKINTYTSNNAFVVPSLAIRKDIGGLYVYVVTEKDGESIVEKRNIETGPSYEENTMVTHGLTENDRVIVKGFHLVSAGMPVSIVE